MGVGQELHKIIVVGIPTNSTAEDLRLLCKPFGAIQEATVVSDADGIGRGFGFVRFANEEAQLTAVEKLNKTPLKGRTLNVRVVEKRSPAGAAAAAGSAKGRPCFDFARGKCSKGAACKWAHVIPAAKDGADATRSRRPEWQQKRDLNTSVPAALQGIPDDICRKFQLGKCHRGAACRWKHEIYRPGAAGSSSGSKPRPSIKRAAPSDLAEEAAAVAATEAGPPPPEAPPKRKRKVEAAAAGGPSATAAAAPAAAVPAPRRPQMAIGGDEAAGGEGEVARLQRQLRQREEAWREKHGDGPVPADAKNRDVVWRALERKLAKLQQGVG